MKYLFIDIRKSDKVYSKHLNSVSSKYLDNYTPCTFYNIPMNMIRFNVKTITNQLENFDEVYIICESSNSSQFIKKKYFDSFTKIKVNDKLQFSNLKHGINTVSVSENNIIILDVGGTKSFNFYSITRIIQTVTGLIMLYVGIFIYMKLKEKQLLKEININPLYILIAFGSMALFNGLTSTCSMSILFKNYLN
jgi:hypothetical protein